MIEPTFDFNRTPVNKPNQLPEGTTVLVLEPDCYYTDHGYPKNGTTPCDFIRINAFPDRKDAVAYLESKMDSKYGTSSDVSQFRLIDIDLISTPRKKISLEF